MKGFGELVFIATISFLEYKITFFFQTHFRFNATLAQNSSVRKEIDHLVQERATFNDMIARLQKKIAGNKKVIADITEMAILAFDQRDEAQSKITALQVNILFITSQQPIPNSESTSFFTIFYFLRSRSL